MRIALLGTRGVPARYGGFETAAEEIGARLAEAGHDVVVYCRNPGQRTTGYRGMRLVNLPAIRARTLETLSHTAISTVHCIVRSRPQVVVLFNPANAPLASVLRLAGIRTAIHMDGLDADRAKWRGSGRRYFRLAEWLSVRVANEVIADSQAIADRLRAVHGRGATFLPYGAPLVDPGAGQLTRHGLQTGGFHLVVARLEPENHVRLIVEGYRTSGSKLPLVVVGSAPYSAPHTVEIRRAAGDADVRLLGAVWDQGLLDQLYANAASYIHGHSVGGTNPSLLRAMGAAAPIMAFDVVFNHETAGVTARYFRTRDDVASCIAADEADPSAARARGAAGRRRASERYVWDDVARGYEALCLRLAGGRPDLTQDSRG